MISLNLALFQFTAVMNDFAQFQFPNGPCCPAALLPRSSGTAGFFMDSEENQMANAALLGNNARRCNWKALTSSSNT